jgi:Kef-type K+ transport system membrane component KefB
MVTRAKSFLLPFIVVLLISPSAWAGGSKEFSHLAFMLLVIFAVAKTFGVLCEKVGIPSLVGELLAGIAIGNASLIGFDSSLGQQFRDFEFIKYAAELGVVFLLFLVGLESSLSHLMKSGVDSLTTAAIGVVIPTVSGAWLIIALGIGSGIEAWFVGATFAATSVGITAKMLSQYNKLASPSSQVILGAAIIDDILGLMLLAALLGVVATGEVSVTSLGFIVIKTLAFFGIAYFIGHYIMPQVFRLYPAIDQPGMVTAVAIMIALAFAEFANLTGLAPIIGAFTAGILLDEVQLKHTQGRLNRESFEEAMKPVTEMLLPIFFVSIGLQVDISGFTSLNALGLVALLTVVAFAGKAICGLLARGQGIDRLGVGLGMVPRGEVGLIFAAYGLQTGVLSGSLYSILILVVLLTTIIGPLVLKTRLHRF